MPSDSFIMKGFMVSISVTIVYGIVMIVRAIDRLDTIKSDIQKIDYRQDSMEISLNNIKSEVTIIKSDINLMKFEISEIKLRQNFVESSIDLIKTDISEIKNRQDSFELSLNLISQNQKTLSNTVHHINVKLKTIRSSQELLENSLNTIQNGFTGLRNDLKQYNNDFLDYFNDPIKLMKSTHHNVNIYGPERNTNELKKLGAGCLISYNQRLYILTCFHCVLRKNNDEVIVLTRFYEAQDGTTKLHEGIKIFYSSSPAEDIAIVQLSDEDEAKFGEYYKTSKISPLELFDGDFMLGKYCRSFAKDIFGNDYFIDGRVQFTNSDGALCISSAVEPGHSGTGLLDYHNKVVGIICVIYTPNLSWETVTDPELGRYKKRYAGFRPASEYLSLLKNPNALYVLNTGEEEEVQNFIPFGQSSDNSLNRKSLSDHGSYRKVSVSDDAKNFSMCHYPEDVDEQWMITKDANGKDENEDDDYDSEVKTMTWKNKSTKKSEILSAEKNEEHDTGYSEKINNTTEDDKIFPDENGKEH